MPSFPIVKFDNTLWAQTSEYFEEIETSWRAHTNTKPNLIDIIRVLPFIVLIFHEAGVKITGKAGYNTRKVVAYNT